MKYAIFAGLNGGFGGLLNWLDYRVEEYEEGKGYE